MNVEATPTIRQLATQLSRFEAPAQSLRVRRRRERRDRVFEAAIALFVERGFEETSMDDIAAASGLARTTVFNHFPRKVAFLEEWASRRRSRAALSLGDTIPTKRPVRAVLGQYLLALADLNRETRTETAALMPHSVRHNDMLIDHPLARDLAELLTEAQPALAPGVDASQVGRLLALAYFSAVARWVDSEPAPFDLAAELASVLDVVVDGALSTAARNQ